MTALGHRELVKRVRDERGIDGPCRQVRVIDVAADDVQIPVAAEQSANPQERERLPAEIDGEDVPFWRNARRHFQCEVSGPGSEIDDRESRTKVQPLQNLFRSLPGVSLLFDSLERVQRFDRLLRHEESWHHDQYQNEGDGPPRRHASDSPIRCANRYSWSCTIETDAKGTNGAHITASVGNLVRERGPRRHDGVQCADGADEAGRGAASCVGPAGAIHEELPTRRTDR